MNSGKKYSDHAGNRDNASGKNRFSKQGLDVAFTESSIDEVNAIPTARNKYHFRHPMAVIKIVQVQLPNE
jgi:hypothetical protein